MKLRVFLLTLLLTINIVFSRTGHAEEIVLTLEEALLIGLRQNYDVLLKEKQIRMAKEKIEQAKGALLPSLGAYFNIIHNRQLYSKNYTQANASLNAKQVLYSGGRIINTIKLTENNFEIAQAILDQTKKQTIYNIAKAFYSLLLTEELIRLNKDILENTQEHLKTLELRYQNGQASELEVLKIKDSLKKIEEALKLSLNQAISGQEFLKNLLNLDNQIRLKAQGKFEYPAQQEIALDQALLTALSQRPEIKQYEAQIKSAEKKAKIAKGENQPTIFAAWDYYARSHSSGVSGVNKNPNDYQTLGLTLSWPVFDGWQTKNRIQEALLEIQQSQIAKEKLLKDIKLELQNAYLKLKNALEQIKTKETESETYAANLKSIQEKYAQGIASHLDLADAQLQNNIASFNKIEAIYQYLVAKLDFEKATGGINEKM